MSAATGARESEGRVAGMKDDGLGCRDVWLFVIAAGMVERRRHSELHAEITRFGHV
jgi:hypothetical protein